MAGGDRHTAREDRKIERDEVSVCQDAALSVCVTEIGRDCVQGQVTLCV